MINDRRKQPPWGRRRNDIRYALMMIVALIATYGAWQAHETAQRLAAENVRAIEANQQRIARLVAANHLALVEACERLQIERSKTNLSNYGDYLVYRVVLQDTRLVAARTATERRFRKLFLPSLRFALATKDWTPLTNCKQAVNSFGVRYRSPRPVPFSRRLPPSAALGF